MNENDELFSEWKRNPSAPIKCQTYNFPITSSDTLSLSYRRLVGAKTNIDLAITSLRPVAQW